MRLDRYIGLFRTRPGGSWRVTIPDLPGCEAVGTSFGEVLERAREALAEHLQDLDDRDDPRPRARTMSELMSDGQRDWLLCRAFVDALMHPVEPAVPQQPPLDLIATSRNAGSGPLIVSDGAPAR